MQLKTLKKLSKIQILEEEKNKKQIGTDVQTKAFPTIPLSTILSW